MLDITQKNCVNGIDLDAVAESVKAIQQDPANGIIALRVRTEWTGQCRSESTIDSCTVGGERIARRHKIVADEPYELLGTDSAPNPQELLMSAVNACMMVGYVAQAAVRGIPLESCTIETRGELDLRGFLGKLLGLLDFAVLGLRDGGVVERSLALLELTLMFGKELVQRLPRLMLGEPFEQVDGCLV